jgi:hypothetical protein
MPRGRATVVRALLGLVPCAACTAASSDRASPGAGGDLIGVGGRGGGTGGGGATGGGLTTGGSAGAIDVAPGGTGNVSNCSTRVSGTVFAPSGTLPLYNAMVYVPSRPLEPLPEGVSCDTCEGIVSGDPVASALSDETGRFVLDDVPAGSDVPLVVQVGKWRRQVSIPKVTACVDTPLDAELTRLPASQAEGHLPKIALSTGGLDALECLLRKIGIADSEFTNPDSPGRVNLYAGRGGTNEYTATFDYGALFPLSEVGLWGAARDLARYDVVLLSCEGGEYTFAKPAEARQAMLDYANAGGRVFFSHWHKLWLEGGPAPLPDVMTFNDVEDDLDITVPIDTTFPKGAALAEWLVAVGGSSTPGMVTLTDAQNTGRVENPELAQRWIYDPLDPTTMSSSVKYVTANTPLGAPVDEQCGRIVYSDLHVATDDPNGDQSSTGLPFPSGCRTAGLTPQEKVLVFMLFDLSACVISDHDPPEPPVVVK